MRDDYIADVSIVESLGLIPDASVDLVVSELSFAESEPGATYALFAALLRVLAPGKRAAILTHDTFDARDATRFGSLDSVRAVAVAQHAGFLVRQHIIVNMPFLGASWLAGKGFPHGPAVVVNQTFADIWVFQKKDDWTSHKPRYAELPPELLPYDVMDREFFERYVRQGVWEADLIKAVDAPSREIVEPLVRMWSRPGETVLDPQPNYGNIGATCLIWKRKPLLVARDAAHAANLRRRIESSMVSAATATVLE